MSSLCKTIVLRRTRIIGDQEYKFLKVILADIEAELLDDYLQVRAKKKMVEPIRSKIESLTENHIIIISTLQYRTYGVNIND